MIKIAAFAGNMQDFKKYSDSLIATSENMPREVIEKEVIRTMQNMATARKQLEELNLKIDEVEKTLKALSNEKEYAKFALEQYIEYFKHLYNEYFKKEA